MRQNLIKLICIVVIVFASWQLIKYFLTYEKVKQQEEELQQEISSSSLIQFQKRYEDMVGWITIDNTKVDYPIMQATNNEFYLTRNYKGEKLRAGSIFLDYRNDPSLSDRHSIIYGHDLRNGSMFGQLHRYEEQSFANSNRHFTIEIRNERITLEVFAAYQTTTDFYYIETEFTSESYEQFIETIINKSVITYEGNINVNDQIITLSTCVSDNQSNERFVVHAKVVERKDLK